MSAPSPAFPAADTPPLVGRQLRVNWQARGGIVTTSLAVRHGADWIATATLLVEWVDLPLFDATLAPCGGVEAVERGNSLGQALRFDSPAGYAGQITWTLHDAPVAPPASTAGARSGKAKPARGTDALALPLTFLTMDVHLRATSLETPFQPRLRLQHLASPSTSAPPAVAAAVQLDHLPPDMWTLQHGGTSSEAVAAALRVIGDRPPEDRRPDTWGVSLRYPRARDFVVSLTLGACHIAAPSAKPLTPATIRRHLETLGDAVQHAQPSDFVRAPTTR